VLVHGLGGNLRNFAPELVDTLAQNHRVIALDRPGSGYSISDVPGPDLFAQAAMVAGLIDALELGPVVLVGHSLGGALSLALVETRPDCVAALALVAPLTQPVGEIPPQFRALMIRSPFGRSVFGWLTLGLVGILAGRARTMPAFAPDPVPADFNTRGGGALVFRPSTFEAASRDAQGIPGTIECIVAGYAAIDRPVHVLFGDGDQILPPGLHGNSITTQIAGARCDRVAGGHMLPYVHAGVTAQWIARVADAVGH